MNPLKLITKPIGCLCSLIGALLLGLILLAFFGLWSFNRLAPQGVAEIVESRGGFPVTVDEAGWQLLQSAFVAEDIVIENPPNFPEHDYLHIRTLSLKGDAKAWMTGETKVIDELVLDIDSVNWVITKGGSSNVALFAESISEQNSAEKSSSKTEDAEPVEEVKVMNWIIRIGTVERSDYSRGTVQREKYILDYEHHFGGGEPASVVVQAVAGEFAEEGLQPVIHQLLTAILSVPDIEGLTEDLNPTPAWLKDKLKIEKP